MANTYTWVINSLECYPTLEQQQNVVCNIFYYVVGTDGTNTVSISGNQAINYISNNSFTPYESLTEAQIITWLQEEIGNNQIIAIQNALDVQLNGLSNPIKIKPKLPWNN
jgi:hypothetical protein